MKHDIEIKLPKLGESIVSATVISWFKKEGDPVALDEALLEVSTDKINSEIPSPSIGILKKILAQPDEEVDVGAPLGILSVEEQATEPPREQSLPVEQDLCPKKSFFTPVVLKLAQEKGVSLEELKEIPTTGAGGRLSKKDLERHLSQKTEGKKDDLSEQNGFEDVKISPMRKKIAENMVKSFYEAPHGVLVNEIDVTKIVNTIAKNKETFFKTHGVKLSITSYIAQAIAKAAKTFPLINSTFNGDTITIKHCVNLGIAVSVENGVFVPVITNCQELSLEQIALQVSGLAERARGGRLTSKDIEKGTITMTNFGMAKALIGIPIIRYPEVAIVGVGAIEKRVVALKEDSVGIRSMMHLSLSFDHRALDGIYGCQFIAEIKKILETSE